MSALSYPQAIRAVFFDVGYTLLAPHPSVIELTSEACARLGMPVDVECLRQHQPRSDAYLRQFVRTQPWTWGDEAQINQLWQRYYFELLRPCLHNASDDDVRRCAEEVQRVFDQGHSYALYPDVVPVLEALRTRPLTLGVISDWGMSLWLILRHHNLVRFFDFAVVSAVVRYAKPDPQLFQTALQRADAIPDYTLHIGDAYPLDVLGARAAGITPILLDRSGILHPEQLDCIVIPNLYGVLDLLEIPRPSS